MRKLLIPTGGLILAAFFVWFTLRWFQGKRFGDAVVQLLHAPGMLVLMTVGYALSFWLKALSWRLYAGREKSHPLRHYIHPLLVSLLVNHVLPIKAGDLVRTGLFARRASVRWDEALHSVAAMRVLDVASLLLIGSAGALVLGLEASPWFGVAIGICVLAAAIGWIGLERLRRQAHHAQPEQVGERESVMKRAGAISSFVLRHYEHLRATLTSRRGAGAALLTFASWLLEGSVIYGVMQALGLPVNPLQAIWATGMTIAGQAFHITPGGIGTYETTLTASLGVLGVSGSAAYTAALLSHGYKFVFAYASGAVSIAMAAVTWQELRSWLRLRGREGQQK